MEKRWDNAHAKNPTSVPSHLYTDDNPATTIKGTGFKNKEIAIRTIKLTSQKGVRYKQYWTIRAMRERAAHHANKTTEIKEAIEVFDNWLSTYKEPSSAEKAQQREEWEEFRKLCSSDANQHSYGKNPSNEELARARKDLSDGKNILIILLSTRCSVKFPLTSFVALFGGPGLHGYGKHFILENKSSVTINDVQELIGLPKTRKLNLSSSCKIKIEYERKKELADATIQNTSRTLEDFWKKTNGKSLTKKNCTKRKRDEGVTTSNEK